MGAGRAAAAEDRPQLVVVAVPPDHLGDGDPGRARARTDAVVTDVGSVKSGPLAASSAARRASSGTSAATRWPAASAPGRWPRAPALFDGRPWAVTPHDDAPTRRPSTLVEALARLCGAVPVRLSPVEHDAAVARTSHVPHLLAALVAGQLLGTPRPTT